MTQFLLVHGAFHGAWCWQKLVAELEKRGHRAKAIDLPGQGADQTPLKEVTLDTMVDKIIAEMADFPARWFWLATRSEAFPSRSLAKRCLTASRLLFI